MWLVCILSLYRIILQLQSANGLVSTTTQEIENSTEANYTEPMHSTVHSTVAPLGLDPFKCYFHYRASMPYKEAKAKCEASGGMLPWARMNAPETAEIGIIMRSIRSFNILLGLHKNSSTIPTTAAEREEGWSWVCPNSSLSIEANGNVNWGTLDDDNSSINGILAQNPSHTKYEVEDYPVETAHSTTITVCIAFLPFPETSTLAAKQASSVGCAGANCTDPMADSGTEAVKGGLALMISLSVAALVGCIIVVMVVGYMRVQTMKRRLDELDAMEKLKEEERKMAGTASGSEVGQTEDFFSQDKDETTAKATVEEVEEKGKCVTAADIVNEKADVPAPCPEMSTVVSQS